GLLDYKPFETWSDDGGQDTAQLANARWKKLLAEYEAPPIDAAVDEALKDFVAQRKAAEPDAFV
ncbi:MAG: trimethylamine methyltransferase family protein, partial [Pseudomonadota bacterium]